MTLVELTPWNKKSANLGPDLIEIANLTLAVNFFELHPFFRPKSHVDTCDLFDFIIIIIIN